VVCVGDEDCAEEKFCGADHLCHKPIACESDIDCKIHELVCDKEGGLCVQCLADNDCAEEEFCKDSFCFADECVAGEAYCDENVVTTCLENGSGWTTTETCGEAQYCEEAECHDYVCDPDAIWCEGEVYKVCAEDGKSVKYEEDCEAKGQHCFNGACIDTKCVPDSVFCEDDFTAAVCSADGMDSTPTPCAGAHYCEGGSCFPWVCTPAVAYCESDVAKLCDAKGSSVANEVNCAASGKVCVDGGCKDLVCSPGADFCVDDDTKGVCAIDGLTFEPTDCAAQHSCSDGLCVAWVCTPGEAMCNGEVATVCDGLGLGPEAGGTDCAGQGKFCAAGECIDCQPQCDGKECGDNGCGGECGSCDDLDPCTGDTCANGVCQHVQIPNCCTSDEYCDDETPCTADFCHPDMGCLHSDIIPCCGNAVVEDGEECDDGNSEDEDTCHNNCTKGPKVLFVGYRNFQWYCTSMTDEECDANMDAACESTYGPASRAATHQELHDGLILNLPPDAGTVQGVPNNQSGAAPKFFKCPYCEGSPNPECVSGHHRVCLAGDVPWPSEYYVGWIPDCMGAGTLSAVCVE